MKSLLLVAHGSRRAESNSEVCRIADCLAGRADGHFAQVACAFLEIAEPSIPDAIREAIHGGADEVVVLPYFLSAGRHVVKDIPAEVDVVRAEYPQVKITLTPYLGSSGEIVDLLLGLAESG